MARDLRGHGPVPESGRATEQSAAVLFIDITGFTAIVDAATARFGDRGAERVQELLNRCFTPMVDAVDRFGGQVLAFPGDAALCIWPVAAGDAAIGLATRQAAACALDLRQCLDRLSTFDGSALRFRAALSAGRIRSVLAGGVDGRWTLLVHGPAIAQLTVMAAAKPGDIAVTDAAVDAAGGALSAARIGPTWLLSAVNPAATPVPPRSPAMTAPDDDVASLVSRSVRARLAAGQQGWMSEFRAVTVVFALVGNGRLDDGAPHHIVRTMQAVNQRFDGDLNQVVVDEKGLTAVMVFGLLHQTHENQSARAVAAAAATQQALVPLGIDIRVGIATGRVFTGIRGGGSRMEFAVIGSTVVLAARLAGAAGDVLCDGATRANVRDAYRFDAVPPTMLKGLGVVTGLWRPREAVSPAGGSIAATADDGVGRRGERQQIDRRLRALSDGGTGGLIVVTGEAGIGKSALVAAAWRSAAALRLRCIAGAGDSIQLTTTLHPWRSIVTALLRGESTEPTLDRLTRLLGHQEAAFFPLLNPVLPVQLPETAQTASMTAENRARVARALLVALLQPLAADGLFVILEDAHWIDSSSWELIEETVAHVPRLLLLVTGRPTADTTARLAALRVRQRVEEIGLTAMTPPEIHEVVVRRIGADQLSDDLARWIDGRCDGNPLFAQELTLMLVERGIAAVEGGTCRVAGARSLTDLASLPDTVHGVLATRIDRLPAEEQLSLKVAAVLGRDFQLEALAAISPMPGPVAELQARIERIAGTGLLRVAPDAPAHVSFSHALVQEVAYGLLPFAQRHTLHRGAAEHFESAGAGAEVTSWPLLAYHWEQADVPARAMHYLERAGEHALLKASSNPEAEEFFVRLLRLADAPARAERASDSAAAIAPVVRARWERWLSQSVARQGRHAAALSHLERGLRWLGRSAPADDWRCRLEVLRGVTRRIAFQPRPVNASQPVSGETLSRLEAARLYDSIVQNLYIGQSSEDKRGANTVLLSTVALLRAVGLGEQVGPCGELSCSYSMIANMVAMLRRPQLALHYSERARQLAIDVDDKQAQFRALTMGQLPAFIFGRWDAAEARLREGLELGASLRNLYENLVGECTLAYIHFHRGELTDAFARFTSIEQRARDSGFVLPQLWGHTGLAEVHLRQNRVSDAVEAAETCLRLARERSFIDQTSRFQAHGLLASARVRQGDYQQALSEVEPATAAAAAGAQLSFSAQSGFVGVSEALIAACASGAIASDAGRRRVRQWLRRFRMAAFCRPILEPSRLQCDAAWERHNGRCRRAERQLAKSIRLAEQLNMPHEADRGRAAASDLAAQ